MAFESLLINPSRPSSSYRHQETSVNDLKRTFEELDKDKSGAIDATELISAIQSLGGVKLSEREARDLLERIDSESRGQSVDFPAFERFMRSIGSHSSNELVRQARILKAWSKVAAFYLIFLFFAEIVLVWLWLLYPRNRIAIGISIGLATVQLCFLIFKVLIMPILDFRKLRKKRKHQEQLNNEQHQMKASNIFVKSCIPPIIVDSEMNDPESGCLQLALPNP